MKDEILEFINVQLLKNRDNVDEHRELLVSGILDSLSVMNLVAFIEKTANRKIPPLDVTLENFSTVSDMVDYLERGSPGS